MRDQNYERALRDPREGVTEEYGPPKGGRLFGDVNVTGEDAGASPPTGSAGTEVAFTGPHTEETPGANPANPDKRSSDVSSK